MQFKPSTQIGQDFDKRYKQLTHHIQNHHNYTTQQVSAEVNNFFEYAQSLSNNIASYEYSITAMFEIDQTLLGSYGERLFSESSHDELIRLLRDIIALYYRYSLLGEIERIKPNFQKISGIRNFYSDWRSLEGITTEGDRVIDNLVALLSLESQLENKSKILLFSILGNILITLGFTAEIVPARLYDYLEIIEKREKDVPLKALAEISIFLYILHKQNGDIYADGINSSAIYKFVRFWVANSKFFHELYSSWGVYWSHDYYSSLQKGDEIFRDSSSLLYKLLNKTYDLGVGRNYTDRDFNIPLFIFGQAGSGKSSLFTAFAYDVTQNPAMRPTTLGRELQAHYDVTYDQWITNTLTSTQQQHSFSFWRNLEEIRYDILDYNGEEVHPERWNQELQQRFIKAKGIIYIIDDTVYTNERKLRESASWFDTTLQYWMRENPGVVHVPVMLLLTKIDKVIGKEISALTSSSIIPSGVQGAAIEYYFPHRFNGSSSPELRSRSGRLKDCLLQNIDNNKTPNLQDIVQNIVDSMGVFLNRVLDLTYNYQIMVSSSLPPSTDRRNSKLPFGVQQPFTWVMDVIEQIYMAESVGNYESEEKNAETNLTGLRNNIKKVYEQVGIIQKAETELHRLRQTPTLMEKTTRTLQPETYNNWVKTQEDYLMIASKEIEQIYTTYFPAQKETNRTLQIQALEAEARRQEDVLRMIRNKRQDYETKTSTR